MSKLDYYQLLGVDRNASADDIKKAFRKLAMQYHPDRNKDNKDAEHKFKEINEAYEVLKDPQKRAQYDRVGHSAFQGGAGGFGGGAGGFDFNDFGEFSDIFSNIFGDFMGGRAGDAAKEGFEKKGSDLRYDMRISLSDAYTGIAKDIQYQAYTACDTCDGKGYNKPEDVITCPECNGKGRIRMQQGFFMVETGCKRCGASGKIIKNPCSKCSGSGRVRKDRKISVQIPPGVEEGTKIRIASEGEAGIHGGRPGDLYIFVSVEKHPFFERRDNDIHCAVPIKIEAAALGGEIEIPAIDGSAIKVTIPEGAQTGMHLRLKGKGMPLLKSKSYGDMIIHLKVETPKNLTKKQKELLKEFAKEENHGSNPECEGFLKSIKKFFKI